MAEPTYLIDPDNTVEELFSKFAINKTPASTRLMGRLLSQISRMKNCGISAEKINIIATQSLMQYQNSFTFETAAKRTSFLTLGKNIELKPLPAFSTLETSRSERVVQCVRKNDSLRPTLQCIATELKSTDGHQALEVAKIASKAYIGKNVDNVCKGVAAAAALVEIANDVAIDYAVKPLFSGLTDYACVSSQGYENRDQCRAETIKVYQQGIEVLARSVPESLLKISEYVTNKVHTLDRHMLHNYFTTPGLVTEGIACSAFFIPNVGGFIKKVSGLPKVAALIAAESKNLKIYKKRDIVKYLTDRDYKLVAGRGKGSHEYFEKPGCRSIIITTHGNEVSHLVAKNAIRTADSSMIQIEAQQSKKITPKIGLNQPLPHRIDYSKNFFNEFGEFTAVKEFNGILHRDLAVIQFHSSVPLGEGRSYKWFMPAMQGNKLITLEDVRNSIVKLTSYGDITHVTLARIPAGEPVRFLHGPAIGKVDPITETFRAGQGIQYRFFDFDEKWVVLTKALSE